MSHVSFNMSAIGRTIARLRREMNMTQVELADRMNVSFQAVSNWERGQSMPDVSKLPELAELLGTSIDELLGRSVPLVEHAAADLLEEYLEEADLSVQEAEEAAPLLKPDQMERVTDRLLGLKQLLPQTDLAQALPAGDAPREADAPPAIPEDVHLPDLTALLPFMSTEKVDMIVRRYAAEDHSLLNACLPFASSALLSELAQEWEAAGRDVLPIAPFLSSGEVDRIVRSRQAAGKPFIPLVPFMNSRTVDELALENERNGQTIAPLAPFISTAVLERIFLDRLGRGASINSLLPFISSSLISRLADAAAKKP